MCVYFLRWVCMLIHLLSCLLSVWIKCKYGCMLKAEAITAPTAAGNCPIWWIVITPRLEQTLLHSSPTFIVRKPRWLWSQFVSDVTATPEYHRLWGLASSTYSQCTCPVHASQTSFSSRGLTVNRVICETEFLYFVTKKKTPKVWGRRILNSVTTYARSHRTMPAWK